MKDRNEESNVTKTKTGRRSFRMPTAYSILLVLLIIVTIITYAIPEVRNATLPEIVLSPVNGFFDAFDVALFVMFLGGFLGVVSKTGALDRGIAVIVHKLKGREMLLIPILMSLFSIGGSTYGMAEETIGFYSLIVATMVAAGFDPLVGATVIMLGAGSGVIGSTVNPFSISAAIDALQSAFPEIEINQTIIIIVGFILWITSLLISIYFVMRYAKETRLDKGKSLLSRQELLHVSETYGTEKMDEQVVFTGRMKGVLIVFGIAFLVMVVSLIPWESFGVTIFRRTAWLTGENLGSWYFRELQAWFFLCSIIAGIVGGLKETKIVEGFVAGAADMVGVAVIIAISRGISILMSQTGLDMFVLDKLSGVLANVSPTLFTIGSYVIYIGLSFLIPSSSGLAAASMPTFGGLTSSLGLSPEIMIMIFAAANGIVNLITPTSGVVMGGLAISRIEWPTYVKFVLKVLGVLFVVNLAVLSVAMIVFS